MFRGVVFSSFLALGVSHAAAKTLCVNPSGSNGCSATIGAAVKGAGSGDQISVGPGIYAESVLITQPVTLTGAGPSLTIINAKGLANGIYVDGLDNPGLANVTISGLTVEFANFEGILLTNVSNSLISNSHVTDNTQSLNFTAGTCPGLPIFETNEGEDCGEGIHLIGTFAVTVANSTIDSNSGGILLSDETGQTYNNVISGNSIHDNVLDCGVRWHRTRPLHKHPQSCPTVSWITRLSAIPLHATEFLGLAQESASSLRALGTWRMAIK